MMLITLVIIITIDKIMSPGDFKLYNPKEVYKIKLY